MKNNIFTQTPVTKPRSNTFDLTHDRKFTCKMGQLVPICLIDTVPGDNIYIKPSSLIRFAPLVTPVMHRCKVYMHFFYVPNRIVWDGWEDFITGGPNGDSETVHAQISNSFGAGAAIDGYGTLWDYFGLPSEADTINGGDEVFVNAIPFAAYQKIYNEYYRDQNLITPAVDELVDGVQNSSSTTDLGTLRTRSWMHDYFTSCLPWTQKGPEAMLPLGSEAPVKAKNDPNYTDNIQQLKGVFTNTGITAGTVQTLLNSNITDGTNEAYIDLLDSHVADLSQATASSINDLRRAFKLQEWLEKNARGGSRYSESIYVHFAVKSPDGRLQRPEYIGGTAQPVKISEVLQTSSTDATTPQANMAGHAISVGGANGFNYYCKEHGYIMGIMSVMPETAYQQGIPRHFSRSDKFDYYWPSFAHIGEQPVLNKELIITDDEETNEGTFGYIPRYSEYKFIPNTVHGDFKDTLNEWTMSRIFSSPPALNQDFIEMDWNETKRIFAVYQNRDNLWCQVLNEVKATRPMPVFGVPKIM